MGKIRPVSRLAERLVARQSTLYKWSVLWPLLPLLWSLLSSSYFRIFRRLDASRVFCTRQHTSSVNRTTIPLPELDQQPCRRDLVRALMVLFVRRAHGFHLSKTHETPLCHNIEEMSRMGTGEAGRDLKRAWYASNLQAKVDEGVFIRCTFSKSYGARQVGSREPSTSSGLLYQLPLLCITPSRNDTP